MTRAFEPGDPVLELAALGQGIPITVLDKDDQPWLRKAEQQKIDEVRALGGYSSLVRTTLLVIDLVPRAPSTRASSSRDSCNDSDLEVEGVS